MYKLACMLSASGTSCPKTPFGFSCVAFVWTLLFSPLPPFFFSISVFKAFCFWFFCPCYFHLGFTGSTGLILLKSLQEQSFCRHETGNLSSHPTQLLRRDRHNRKHEGQPLCNVKPLTTKAKTPFTQVWRVQEWSYVVNTCITWLVNSPLPQCLLFTVRYSLITPAKCLFLEKRKVPRERGLVTVSYAKELHPNPTLSADTNPHTSEERKGKDFTPWVLWPL